MELLLFGGTFDPPHNGHLSILRNAVAAVHPDKVLVVPSGVPPHKQPGDTPAWLRMEMCCCFAPLFPDLEVSGMEMRRGGKSYTWLTVQALQKAYPGASIHLCIGGDMVCSFTGWYHWQDLLQAVVLVVQSREKEKSGEVQAAGKALEKQGGRIVYVDGPVEEISSSQVRAAVAAGQDISGLVPPVVKKIIQDYGLYKAERCKPLSIVDAQKMAKEKLSPKRYIHESNVVDAAVRLAKRWGGNEQQAALAGWLHDIVKEESRGALLQWMEQDAIMATATRQRPLPVWHGPCAAVFARNVLDVKDEAVLSAVACHTTGKVGMGRLDKILFVADMISAERDYPGVEQMRQLAMENLDEAVIAIMQQSIDYVESRGRPLDEESVRALEAMRRDAGV